MVDSVKYGQRIIDELKILCKECTRQNARGFANGLHNIWELDWVRDSYFRLLGEIIDDITSNRPTSHKWSRDALEDFWQLGVLRYGGMKAPLNLDDL